MIALAPSGLRGTRMRLCLLPSNALDTVKRTTTLPTHFGSPSYISISHQSSPIALSISHVGPCLYRAARSKHILCSGANVEMWNEARRRSARTEHLGPHCSNEKSRQPHRGPAASLGRKRLRRSTAAGTLAASCPRASAAFRASIPWSKISEHISAFFGWPFNWACVFHTKRTLTL